MKKSKKKDTRNYHKVQCLAEGGSVVARDGKGDSESLPKDDSRYGGNNGDLPVKMGANEMKFWLANRAATDEQPDVRTSIRKKSR